MLQAFVKALDLMNQLEVLGLAARPPLTNWTFDAGPAHLDRTEAAFLGTFGRLQA
jgi:hypothetical protein